MRYLSFLIILVLFSCGNEKVIELAEIEKAEITEVLDVSPAYIFYDETQPDSTLFNRKNLISTTNWLVNVDKRLTLKQVIPHIQYLQNKRRKASMHKNENAKNYFTCNDTGIKNLGFLEFTEIDFINKNSKTYLNKLDLWKKNQIEIHFTVNEKVLIKGIIGDIYEKESGVSNFSDVLINLNSDKTITAFCSFNRLLTFQNYISVKSELSKLNSKGIIIDNNEFFY